MPIVDNLIIRHYTIAVPSVLAHFLTPSSVTTCTPYLFSVLVLLSMRLIKLWLWVYVPNLDQNIRLAQSVKYRKITFRYFISSPEIQMDSNTAQAPFSLIFYGAIRLNTSQIPVINLLNPSHQKCLDLLWSGNLLSLFYKLCILKYILKILTDLEVDNGWYFGT